MISCVNGIDRQYPDYVDYSNQRIPAAGVKLNVDPEFLVCCDCTDGCQVSKETIFTLAFLAHLSRRLMGELIVYQSLRRPSVVLPSTISNIFSSETTGPIKLIVHMETP